MADLSGLRPPQDETAAAAQAPPGGGSPFLILSGDYVGDDLAADYGRLPVSMLPHRGKRLYESQCDLAEASRSKPVLVLPDDYALPAFDQGRLAARGVRVVRSPHRSTLIGQIEAGLELASDGGDVFVLVGDTMVETAGQWPKNGFAFPNDGSRSDDSRKNGGEPECPEAMEVAKACGIGHGLLHFADRRSLLDMLGKTRDFNRLLELYAAKNAVIPVLDRNCQYYGNAQAYYRSASRCFSTRRGNQITRVANRIIKSGADKKKIIAEAKWFKSLPPALHRFSPEFLCMSDADEASYELEYLPLPLLSDLYTLSALPFAAWLSILEKCRRFIETMHAVPRTHGANDPISEIFFCEMIERKTASRLRALSRKTGLDLDADWRIGGRRQMSINGLVERLMSLIRPTSDKDIVFFHGDLHFGNMLFDAAGDRICVLDPRGMLPDGTFMQFGDARYDMAKLCHSVLGLYDFIISGRYQLNWSRSYEMDLKIPTGQLQGEVIEAYSAMTIGNVRCVDRDILAITALLFLSMAEIHDEALTTQVAMIGNAYRLALLAESHP